MSCVAVTIGSQFKCPGEVAEIPFRVRSYSHCIVCSFLESVCSCVSAKKRQLKSYIWRHSENGNGNWSDEVSGGGKNCEAHFSEQHIFRSGRFRPNMYQTSSGRAAGSHEQRDIRSKIDQPQECAWYGTRGMRGKSPQNADPNEIVFIAGMAICCGSHEQIFAKCFPYFARRWK